MTLLHRLFTRTPFTRPADPRDQWRPLYTAIVAHGRHPSWYLAGAPDTLDGRFDMIAAVLAHVLLRLEAAHDGADNDAARRAGVLVTELFVADMDGQLREIGVGDLMVGKHIGKMMSALGGRLTAYRAAAGDAAALADPLVRNLWRDANPGDDAVARVAAQLSAFAADLRATPLDALLAGRLPALAV